MKPKPIIAARDPGGGWLWDPQCARCGALVDEATMTPDCHPATCEANPLPGRKAREHGEVEWFAVEKVN